MKQSWESAARHGDATSLSNQLAAGAEIDSLDRYGQSALMLAAVRGHHDAVRVLVDSGADLDLTAKYNLSALMLAAVNKHEEVARLLAAAGADRSLRGSGAPGFFDKSAADLAGDAGLDALARELVP